VGDLRGKAPALRLVPVKRGTWEGGVDTEGVPRPARQRRAREREALLRHSTGRNDRWGGESHLRRGRGLEASGKGRGGMVWLLGLRAELPPGLGKRKCFLEGGKGRHWRGGGEVGHGRRGVVGGGGQSRGRPGFARVRRPYGVEGEGAGVNGRSRGGGIGSPVAASPPSKTFPKRKGGVFGQKKKGTSSGGFRRCTTNERKQMILQMLCEQTKRSVLSVGKEVEVVDKSCQLKRLLRGENERANRSKRSERQGVHRRQRPSSTESYSMPSDRTNKKEPRRGGGIFGSEQGGSFRKGQYSGTNGGKQSGTTRQFLTSLIQERAPVPGVAGMPLMSPQGTVGEKIMIPILQSKKGKIFKYPWGKGGSASSEEREYLYKSGGEKN